MGVLRNVAPRKTQGQPVFCCYHLRCASLLCCVGQAGFEPTTCGVDNAVLGHRFRFLRLHRSTTELLSHGARNTPGIEFFTKGQLAVDFS